MLEYYNNIDKEKLCDGVTQIVAMDFGEYFQFLVSRNVEIMNQRMFIIFYRLTVSWSIFTSQSKTFIILSRIVCSLVFPVFPRGGTRNDKATLGSRL